MKIAVVTSFPPSKITLNEYAFHLVKSLSDHEKISEIVLLTDHTVEEKDLSFKNDDCIITVKECWSFNSYWNLKSVTKAINETNPDQVLFNLQFMKFGDKKVAAALGLMLPLMCKLKKIPSVVLLHNIIEEVDLSSAGFTNNIILKKAYNLIGSLLTRLILQADVVAVTMQKYVTILQEKYNASNVRLIPHGTFETPQQEPSYDANTGALKVMTFGKFGTYKKVENMIEAVELVRERTHLDIEIIVAGTDNPNVPGYLEGVKKKYSSVEKVTFTGYVEEDEVPVIFRESDIVIFPYTSTTGSSGVLHQAGSYGKAVVMPDLGDLALLTKEEGYRGEFFEPTSINSLADAIEVLLTNDAHRRAIARSNFEAATAYPMSKIAQLYVDVFDELQTESKSVNHLQVVN